MLTIPLLIFTLIFSSAAVVEGSRDHLGDMKDQVSESVYHLSDRSGAGTGFAVRAPSGKTYIVSNWHVCSGGFLPIMSARDSSGKITQVKILELSDDTDLCLLEAPMGASPLPIADKPTSGEVFVVGYPLINHMSVTSGHIIGSKRIRMATDLPPDLCVGKKFKLVGAPKPIRTLDETMLQTEQTCLLDIVGYVTSAPTDIGASGSPLLNPDGEVAGVIMGYTGNISWAMAVRLSDLKNFLKNK